MYLEKDFPFKTNFYVYLNIFIRNISLMILLVCLSILLVYSIKKLKEANNIDLNITDDWKDEADDKDIYL